MKGVEIRKAKRLRCEIVYSFLNGWKEEVKGSVP